MTYLLLPTSGELYDIVRRRDSKLDGASPYWIGIASSLSLDEAYEQVKIMNGEPIDDLDNRFFFYDEGNHHYHRVDSSGNRIGKGRQEPLGYLSEWNLEKRIWIECPSSQEPMEEKE